MQFRLITVKNVKKKFKNCDATLLTAASLEQLKPWEQGKKGPRVAFPWSTAHGTRWKTAGQTCSAVRFVGFFLVFSRDDTQHSGT